MKSIITRISATACIMIICSNPASAQKAPETNPKADRVTLSAPDMKNPAPLPSPQPVASEKKSESVKPIVPGGEFKPMDSGNFVSEADQTEKYYQQNNLAVPEKMAEKYSKKSSSTNPAAKTQQNDKPAQQQVVREQ